MASVFQLHVERWSSCTLCDLHKGRQTVVISRGRVPCDVLFIGEAPGESENVIGKPFVGPAGKLLDRIIASGLPKELTYALTNLVACVPHDEEGQKTTEPPDESIEACAPRLIEFARIANPRAIVCVGKLAATYLEPGYKHTINLGLSRDLPVIRIAHPASILRANEVQRSMAMRRCVVQLRTMAATYLVKSNKNGGNGTQGE